MSDDESHQLQSTCDARRQVAHPDEALRLRGRGADALLDVFDIREASHDNFVLKHEIVDIERERWGEPLLTAAIVAKAAVSSGSGICYASLRSQVHSA